MERNSVLDMFLGHAEATGGRVAALAKREGAYRSFTWGELAAESRRIAQGLLALGVAPGDRVCIMAQTSVEWVLCDMAILAVGGVTVPIYPSNVAEECQYITADCGAVVVFTDDASQTQKFRTERPRLGNVRAVVQLRGRVDPSDGWIIGLLELKSRGGTDENALLERRAQVGRDSIATIIYTSGTTGHPKGVVLTHDALLYEAEAISEAGLTRPTEMQFIFLPLAHSLGKVLVIAWIATGHVLAFAESTGTIMENLGEVHPTLMAAVPRIFEKVYAAVVHKGLAQGGVRGALFRRALSVSERHGEAEQSGVPESARDAIEYAAMKRLVFGSVEKRLREALGGQMRIMISGGAPLSPKIAWFFRDAAVTILEGYGLTESCAATTVNRPERTKIGTVGPPLPGTELRIADDGEVLIRGRGVMRGYWNKPEETAEALDSEGFLHTGDIGVLDTNGFLRITDRKKDIIVTAGGKNVAPQNIENLIKTHPLISQVVVHGDKRKFLSALITLDPDNLKRVAAEHGLGSLSYADLSQHPEVSHLVDEAIKSANQQLASFESIKRWKVLPHDFTVESGEITPSLKLRRRLINERYKSIFDGFYEERY